MGALDRGAGHAAVEVTCTTCHRGQSRPRMLEDILADAVAEGGADAAETKYRELREAAFGGFTYDFQARLLADFADGLSIAGDGEGAIQLHEMRASAAFGLRSGSTNRSMSATGRTPRSGK